MDLQTDIHNCGSCGVTVSGSTPHCDAGRPAIYFIAHKLILGTVWESYFKTCYCVHLDCCRDSYNYNQCYADYTYSSATAVQPGCPSDAAAIYWSA